MAIDPNNLAGTAKLTFSDEFNSLSLWNGTSGTWNTTDAWDNIRGYTLQGNGEEQWYINSAYAATASVKPWSVNNGVLSLTAQETPDNLKPLLDNLDYTSGQINSYHSFSQLYGYFEISAKLPSGSGLWPAFWLLPEDRSWPPELDIMENLGQNPNAFYATVHSNASGSHTMEGNGIDTSDLSSSYHRYGVDWESDKITWYLDGKQVFQADTPSDLHSPMYMIANLAVGGYWPGSPGSDTRFPESYDIDYIRAYSSNPNAVAAPTTDQSSSNAGGHAATPADPSPAASNGSSAAHDTPATTPAADHAAPSSPVAATDGQAAAPPASEPADVAAGAPTPVASPAPSISEPAPTAEASGNADAPTPVASPAPTASEPAPVAETAGHTDAPVDAPAPQPVAEASPTLAAPTPAAVVAEAPVAAPAAVDQFDFSNIGSRGGWRDAPGLNDALSDLMDRLGDFTAGGGSGGHGKCQSFAIHYNEDSGFHFAESGPSHGHSHSHWDHHLV